MESSIKDHWNRVYETKQPQEVSWTEEMPATSLAFIQSFNLGKNASIIDIGGGDSKLVDYLLEEGYSDITVLDISEKSLARAKKRLGEKSKKVNWIVSDIKQFKPERKYDLWHDRAAFHFLTTEEEVSTYLSIVRSCVKEYMIVGTFSLSGPNKCSGLSVKQYDDKQLTKMFMDGFSKIKCIQVDHTTPFQTTQHFTFCSFKSIAA
jgi:cyclopropane fatty-acyl-phospholipid synthase-like methyltransferase